MCRVSRRLRRARGRAWTPFRSVPESIWKTFLPWVLGWVHNSTYCSGRAEMTEPRGAQRSAFAKGIVTRGMPWVPNSTFLPEQRRRGGIPARRWARGGPTRRVLPRNEGHGITNATVRWDLLPCDWGCDGYTGRGQRFADGDGSSRAATGSHAWVHCGPSVAGGFGGFYRPAMVLEGVENGTQPR